MVERVLFRDRKHPVDRVIINDFNRKIGVDLGEVKIVYGLAEWVEGQERAMPEEEYLKLLYKYREYLERKA